MSYRRSVTGENQASLETTRPLSMGKRGAVASPHYLASQVGMLLLRDGGHAADACIAMNAVLCVVYGHMAGLGGDCFAQVWDGAGGRVEAINGSGRSGENLTIDAYRERDLVDIPRRGPLAAITVPGVVDTWSKLHQRYGRVAWADLFEGAIDYAEHGFPISLKFSDYIGQYAGTLARFDEAARIFLPGGREPVPGQTVIQKDLARTLRTIAKGGPDEFYRGELAGRMVQGIQEAGGLLTTRDLSSHTSDWVDPISTTYRGLTVTELPPNTQGLVTLMILNMIENYDLNELNDGSPDYHHLIVEATKLAFVDRDTVGDPAFVHVPLELLLSKDYARERIDQVDMRRARNPEEFPAPKEPAGVARGAGIARGDTTYMCAADSQGNFCSMIQSVYHEFGSMFVPPGTGILMQNRGTFFNLDERSPNKLEPRRRVFHTIIPAMALKDGKPLMAFGSMGGEGQPQTQIALLTRIHDFGYDGQQAIDAPRWLYGRTWGTESNTLKLESRIPDHVGVELARRGHTIERLEWYSQMMGHAQAVIDRGDHYEAAADPRGDGQALAW